MKHRNITGYWEIWNTRSVEGNAFGVYAKDENVVTTDWNGTSKHTAKYLKMKFDANNSSGSMAGHASSNEIRPYSIKLLPLIAY